MSILIPEGQSRTGLRLPDGAPVAGRARLRRPTAPALVALASYVGCTVASALTAAASRAEQAGQPADVEALWRISWLTVVVALLATAAWARRVASVARAQGVPNVRPGRIAWSWLVPVFGPPAAIRQIGRLVREFDYSERRLGFWMFGLYAHTVVLIGASVVVVARYEGPDGVPVLEAVQRQTNVLWLQAAMSVLLTLLAGRAVLHADRAFGARS